MQKVTWLGETQINDHCINKSKPTKFTCGFSCCAEISYLKDDIFVCTAAVACASHSHESFSILAMTGAYVLIKYCASVEN